MPDVVQESIHVKGPRRLAGELAYTVDSPRAICLLINPHPYMGGRMDNNIIARLASTLSAARIATLRFDYAGVGSSEGQAIDVIAAMAEFWRTGHAPVDDLMIEDAASSLAWLRAQRRAPLFVVGYSFGAYVASQIAPDDCAALVLISPTLRHHEIDVDFAPGVPKLIISSDNDFATDSATLSRWFEALQPPKRQRRIPGGQHFFRGMESEVARLTLEFFNDALDIRGVNA